MFRVGAVLLLTVTQILSQSTQAPIFNTVTQTTQPATRVDKQQIQTPGPPYIPPVVTQCFYESKWYPAGAIINAGRSGNFCFGAYCGLDGHVKHWSNNNCPKPDPDNPKPPFPEIPKPTNPPPMTTQAPIKYQGCFYGEKYYFPGEFITRERRGMICSGVYCDFTSRIQPWVDYCRDTIIPIPLDLT